MNKPHAQQGFTLVEILVVIGILSLLVVAFSPAISRTLGKGENAETQARIIELVSAIDSFESKFGAYPPHDFANVFGDELPVNVKADSVNSGIESLVVFLSWKSFGGVDLSDHEDWLANTDGDENSVTIPMLDRKAKVEVVDAWGSPFAYFSSTTGYDNQKQTIQLPEGDGGGGTATAKPIKNPNSSSYLGNRKYQIISAGPDRVFGTEDDLSHPKLPVMPK